MCGKGNTKELLNDEGPLSHAQRETLQMNCRRTFFSHPVYHLGIGVEYMHVMYKMTHEMELNQAAVPSVQRTVTHLDITAPNKH